MRLGLGSPKKPFSITSAEGVCATLPKVAARIALDATYSVGDNLSGVGLYSREMLFGLAAAHPDASFRFCYRPHRFLKSFRDALPRNASRGLLQEPLRAPRSQVFHGLNQRLPMLRVGP